MEKLDKFPEIQENVEKLFKSEYGQYFKGGLIESLAIPKDVATPEWVMEVIDYDTIISESASNVTTDIKYLLSIVRVVLKNPKIFLFDETLNAFPKEIDLQLMDYFRKTKGKHNVIIISKEKHVIEDSDQVIYMEKGTVVASGKHETLILKNGDYQKYFNEL